MMWLPRPIPKGAPFPMQYSLSPVSVAAAPSAATTPAAVLALDPYLVVPRPAGDLAIPLRDMPTLLAAILAALVCNQRSQLAAAEWLRDQAPAVQRLLGFRPGHTPHQTTFNR